MHPLDALGSLWNIASPATPCIAWLEAATSAVKTKVLGNVRICVLGSTKFSDPQSEALVESLAQQLDRALLGTNIVFITGGLSGVQETFTNHCGDGSRLFHLVPMKRNSLFRLGQDVQAGADMDQRRQVFGAVGDVYLSVEGGPGVAQEARAARERGAYILPLMRSGGASSGMFDFPADCRPDFVSEQRWELLADKSLAVEESAKAATDIIVDMVQRVCEAEAEVLQCAQHF